MGPNGGPTDNVANAEAYDDIKVAAILNEIAGRDHTGSRTVGTPAIFGMNFQAVSVGQKTVGYLDAAGTPSPALEDALAHTDASIGRMLAGLEQQGLVGQTLVIVSAKHGQSPIDLSLRRIVNSKLIPNAVNAISPGLVGQATEDDPDRAHHSQSIGPQSGCAAWCPARGHASSPAAVGGGARGPLGR